MLKKMFIASGLFGYKTGLECANKANVCTQGVIKKTHLCSNTGFLNIIMSSITNVYYTAKNYFFNLLSLDFSAVSTPPITMTTSIYLINYCGGCCEATSHTGKFKPGS